MQLSFSSGTLSPSLSTGFGSGFGWVVVGSVFVGVEEVVLGAGLGFVGEVVLVGGVVVLDVVSVDGVEFVPDEVVGSFVEPEDDVSLGGSGAIVSRGLSPSDVTPVLTPSSFLRAVMISLVRTSGDLSRPVKPPLHSAPDSKRSGSSSAFGRDAVSSFRVRSLSTVVRFGVL